MILRLCLTDGSSILIEHNSLENLHSELEEQKFINYKNIKVNKYELIATNQIRFVRKSSKASIKDE